MKKISIALVCTIRQFSSAAQSVQCMKYALSGEQYDFHHEHITGMNQEKFNRFSNKDRKRYLDQVVKIIRKCDVVISESSAESVSVGYLLSKAIELGKPTVVFRQKSAPSQNLLQVFGNEDSFFLVEYQSLDELRELVKDYVSLAHATLPSRYNIMLPQDINNYLQWIAQNKQQTKSEFIRELIRTHMSSNQVYLH